jgi:hypothetical protein
MVIKNFFKKVKIFFKIQKKGEWCDKSFGLPPLA